MGRLLKLGVLAVALGVVAIAGATAAFAVEPSNPPTLDTNCNLGPSVPGSSPPTFCVRVFPICRPGPPDCAKGPAIVNDDQFDDADPIALAKPKFLWLPATVTTHEPPNERTVVGDPKEMYCYATEPGPDRPNVVRITTRFASIITPIGPSNRLCVPDVKIEL